MNDNSMEESGAKIDRYARSEGRRGGPFGISRGLPIENPPVNLEKSHVFGPDAATRRRLTEISDAMAAVAIGINAEVIETQSILDYIGRKLAHQNPVAAPKLKGSARKHFDRMLQAGLWAQHGRTQKGRALYSPVIRCNGSMCAIFAPTNEEKELTYPSIANRMALRRYSDSAAIWAGATVLRDYDFEKYFANLIFTSIDIDFRTILKFLCEIPN